MACRVHNWGKGMKIKATASMVSHDLVERKSDGSPTASAVKSILYGPATRYALPAWATLLLSCSSLSFAAESEASKDFKIEGQPLAAALSEFARQSDRQILFSTDIVDAKHSSGIAGKLTPEAALQQLLKGTGLTFRSTSDEIILIDKPKQSATANFPALLETRLAQVTNASETSSLSTDSAAQSVHAADAAQPQDKLEEIIVTGVFKGIEKQNAAIAITTVDAEEIRATAPISALDLLRSVPGVYVDSSRGVVGTTFSTRGSDAISILEDGLPLFFTGSPSGASSLLRSDLTLARVEAVRGGSAAITGSNTPGGIVNFISKTGGDTFAGEVAAGYNRQGNGDLPGYTFDMNLGGPMSNGWFYNVGGFYRHDYGSHDSGYATNFGFQLKGNIVKKFERGSLKIYAKWLDDHNGLNDSVPAVNYKSPRPAVGFNEVSFGGPPALSYQYQTGENSFATYDTTDVTRNESRYIGIEFNTEVGDRWFINNNARYVRDRLNQSITSRPYPSPINNFANYLLMGTFQRPGTYTLTDPTTGRSAQVQTLAGLFDAAPQFFPPTGNDSTVLNNTLPASQLNIALNQSADVIYTSGDQWIEQLTVTKQLDRMSFTAGAFFHHMEVVDRNKIVGFGFSTFEPQPRMLDVTLESGGQIYQVTNPAGFAAPNTFANVGSRYKGYEMAYFFGHRWDFIDQWTLDWGVRFGRSSGSGGASSPGSIAVASATGGLDGNPNTLYDNQYVVDGPFIDVDRSRKTTSYSAALNYAINDRNAVYARYSAGKVARLNFLSTLNNPAAALTTPWIPVENTQAELGYKLAGHRYGLELTAYDSKQNSRTFFLLTNAQNQLETRFGPENENRFYGVEAEGEFHFDEHFALKAALNWQKGELVHSYAFVNGVPVDQNAGNEATNPDVLFTLTPSYSIGRFYGQLQWRYTGERQANNANAFVLPAYHLTDLNLQWQATSNIDLSFNVTNIFNRAGPMQWNPGGNIITFPDSVTKEQIEANPDRVFVILPIQSRAYYLKATFRF